MAGGGGNIWGLYLSGAVVSEQWGLIGEGSLCFSSTLTWGLAGNI